jgi:hypothetical protein
MATTIKHEQASVGTGGAGVTPEGAFLTYGVGVPLLKMRTPAAARARVPVTQEGVGR